MTTDLTYFAAIRSIATYLLVVNFYFCALINLDNNLKYKYMAGKTTHMSTLKQVLQLHKSGASNRSIASQLGIYKETVNKYIRQFKALNIEVDTLLYKDDPELEYIFNGGAPASVDKRFEDFSKRISYLGKELNKKNVTRMCLWE